MSDPTKRPEPGLLWWGIFLGTGLLLLSYPWLAPAVWPHLIAGVPVLIVYVFGVMGALILAGACLRPPM